jgi:tRNA A-37 threonylcarbamoyl transferase component Bud32
VKTETREILLFKIKNRSQHFHGRKLYMAENWQAKLAEFGLVPEADWLKLTPGEPVSRSNRSNVYKVPLTNGQHVFFKSYSLHGEYMHYFMRQSQAAREVNSYQTMERIGIPTVKPLAFGEERIFGMLKSCCIVTLGVDDTTTLEKFAFYTWRHLEKKEKKEAFEQIFTKTARHANHMHRQDFFHYDLKWRNILVKKEGTEYKTVWIDSPRGKTMHLRSNRGRMLDLSCLSRLALSYLSKTQRYRFVVEYLGEDATRENVRKIWQDVSCHLSRRPPTPVDFAKDRR